MLICDYLCLGLQAHEETYTRDATAVSVKHSEEVELDMSSMTFKLEEMVLRNH